MVLPVFGGSRGGYHASAELTGAAELATLSNRVSSLEKPSRYELRSIQNFWHEHCPLVVEETFLFDKRDLVNLSPPGDVAWLDDFLLNILVRLSCAPLRLRSLT